MPFGEVSPNGIVKEKKFKTNYGAQNSTGMRYCA